jgi:hypothetical protein
VFFGNIFDGKKSDPICGRLTKDGTLDSTFGTGGIVDLDFGKGINFSPGIRAISGGRFITGVNRGTFQNSEIHLVTLESDGSLDETFGTKGFCELENLPSP